jgi:hypothetical protein
VPALINMFVQSYGNKNTWRPITLFNVSGSGINSSTNKPDAFRSRLDNESNYVTTVLATLLILLQSTALYRKDKDAAPPVEEIIDKPATKKDPKKRKLETDTSQAVTDCSETESACKFIEAELRKYCSFFVSELLKVRRVAAFYCSFF